MERADAHFVECSPDEVDVIKISYVDEVEGGLDSYKYTYISELAEIWGVPFADSNNVIRIDPDNAVNVGGGIVGINFNNAAENGAMRFESGDRISIKGTTNYEGNHTLTSGTTTTQLQFADTYNAETFDGSETVVKYIYCDGASAGAGRMAMDSSYNLYYGIQYNNGTCIIKFEAPDETQVNDFFSPDPAWGATDLCDSLVVSSDNNYLYAYADNGYIYKFNLSDGSQVWAANYYSRGHDIALDADDNVWIHRGIGTQYITKLDADDGAATSYLLSLGTGVSRIIYDVKYDTDNDKVVVGGYELVYYTLYNTLYNLIIFDVDTQAKTYVTVGTNYKSGNNWYSHIIGNGCIAIKGDYIYVLLRDTKTIHKFDMSGNEIDSVSCEGSYPEGIFFDIYGNLVQVDADVDADFTTKFYFYDTDLAYQANCGPFNVSMLNNWQNDTGGAWMQGNFYNVGSLESPASDGYWQIFGSDGEEILWTNLIGETVCILADGVVYPSQVVDDNGRIDATDFSTATKIHVGLNYESKLRPMKAVANASQIPKIVTCKQMGISVHNADEIEYGVDDDDMKEVDFSYIKNKCDIDGLYTGTVNLSVPDGFSVNLPLQISTDQPLPATVRAMIPKVD